MLTVSEVGSCMAGLERITQPTLDVLEVLVRAYDDNEQIHGWAIMKATKRAGPTVYKRRMGGVGP